MMGRELKRVPLDFSWPLKRTWKGYINPITPPRCGECDGTGYNPDGKFLHDTWYSHIARDMFGPFFGANILAAWSREKLIRAGWSEEICRNIEFARKFGFKTLTQWHDKLEEPEVKALIDDDRLWDFTHDYKPGEGWKRKEPSVIPTPDEVNAWSANSIGHDAINAGVCIRARAVRFGVTSITCPFCLGHGEILTEEERNKYEAWERQEPPTGDGFQLWETTSEGSPISPVFKTIDELCAWAETNATTFGSEKVSAVEWQQMLGNGLVGHRQGNMFFM